VDTQEHATSRKTARLMISYSHRDKDFVQKIYNCLLAEGFDAEDIWVDWEGIPFSAEWMKEITKGIQTADVFLFVISPESASSEVCQQEIEIASQSNKRFIPILYKALEPGTQTHNKISSHQWVPIPNEEELEKVMPVLVETINTDLDWLAQHTRLYNRALEWESKGRNDSYLVRGQDLQDALTFISNGAAGKEPSPSPLHIEYVQAAQNYATAIRRRNRIIAVAVGVVLALLAVFALIGWGNARAQQARAERGEQNANAQAQAAQANAQIAQANAQQAQSNAQEAQANEATAEKNSRTAHSLTLASASALQKSSNTQLALMLALLSIQETQQDQTVLPESKSALFESLNVPNVLYTLPEQDSSVTAVAVDPTGTYLATGSQDGQVILSKTRTGEQLQTIQQDGIIEALDFSTDGSKLGVASSGSQGRDGLAKVWSVPDGTELYDLSKHSGAVNDIAFSPDGKLIATAGEDGVIKFWDAAQGVYKSPIYNNGTAIYALDFSPDSSLLVSGGAGNDAVLWNVETGGLVRTLRGHEGAIYSVAFNPAGDRIITGSADLDAIVWNVADGSPLQTLRGNHSTIYGVDYAPDGRTMLTAASGVKLWDYFYGTERFNLAAHHGEVLATAYSKDGQYILTGSRDRTAKLWANFLLIDTLKMKQNTGRNLDAQYSSDGNWIVTTDEWGNILVHDAKNGEAVEKWAVKNMRVNAAAFDPTDSQRIVTGENDGTVNVWSRGRATPLLTIDAHSDAVTSAIFSPDGSKILSASRDGSAKAWDAQDGSLLLTLDKKDTSEIYDARFSDDGSQIVTAGSNQMAQTWDAQTGSRIKDFLGHTDYVRAAVFSHDGSRLYTASDDNTIKVWDTGTGKQLQNLTGHVGYVKALALSPDGKLLASAGTDTTVKIWDLSTGKILYDYLGNNEDVNSAAFSQDGKRVLTASSDETSTEFVIDFDELLKISQEYELQPLTREECQRFLYQDDCALTLVPQPEPNREIPGSPSAQETSTP
jgi:WD40 repeat protein